MRTPILGESTISLPTPFHFTSVNEKEALANYNLMSLFSQEFFPRRDAKWRLEAVIPDDQW